MDFEFNADLFVTEPVLTLYHYASVKGLKGIITNNAIWATSYQHLNDTTEISYGLGIFREVVQSADFSKECNFDFEFDYERDFVRLISDYDSSKDVYCCSFSANGNLLSQWRGYCPKSCGVSIGFDGIKLKETACKNGFRLYKCEYERQKQKTIATDALRDVLWSFSSNNDYFRKDRLPRAIRSCMNFLSPMFKHPDFFEENEWRLVSVYGDFSLLTLSRPKYKRSKRLVPYVNLPIGDSINKIVVGPSRKQPLFQKRLLKLLAEKELPAITIEKSSTPYRNG